MNTEQRPTPETDAFMRTVGVAWHEFARKIERERDEARENKDRISQRAEAIRRELVEKDKQIEAMRKTLIESEAYQAGLVADIEAMREAIEVRDRF